MTTEERINQILAPLVAEIKQKVYLLDNQNQISDAECLGVICSKFLKWDPSDITEMAKSAFEDANMKDGLKGLEQYEDQEELI